MSDVWSRMDHWDLVLPPSRPDAYQLELIRRVISDVDRGAPVGVLGSTPEFRDLLAELGFSDIRIFERNNDSYRRMSALRSRETSERLVEGDWLMTLPLQAQEMHLLLSDLTMGNIPYDSREAFYGGVRLSLATGGLFIDKVLRHPEPGLPVSRLLEKYAWLPLNLATVNRFSCEALFCSELLDVSHVVDTSALYDELASRPMAANTRAVLARTPLITPRNGRWWYGRPWHRLEPEYCAGLRILAAEEDRPESPYAGRVQVRVYRRED